MGNLSKIHFQDEDFIRKNSLQCTLFIQVTEEKCRILILDEEKNIRLIEEQESDLFLNKDWIFVNLKFAKTFITTLPETFIFIPEEFHNTDQETLLSSFLDPDHCILNKKIENTPITTYFTINDRISDFQNLLRESKLIPSSNILIQKILSIASKNTEVVGINFYEDDFELAYVKNKQFIFCNRFPKANADDFNFYLLSLIEQFAIRTAHVQFYLAGNIDEQNENYERLAKYSSHIHFLSELQKPSTFDTLIVESETSNQFYLLSELSKCE